MIYCTSSSLRETVSLSACGMWSFSPFFFFFVSHLRPMALNVLGYQSHPLQRCHPACGHEGSSHLSPVLALWIFIAIQVQHSYNSYLLTFHAFRYGSQNTNSSFPKNRTHDFRTSRCTWLPIIDYSGDEGPLSII